ncbi:calcium-binding protein [Microvirga zambiensis]|uniref:calcium-binding protein n=1 Tax=Microvirga zambiensis TaxID=1402137 RepID=UPI00191D86F4|nr:calcium-binding protein [Microvirga zambiensis]
MAIEKWGNWALNRTLITGGSADHNAIAALPNCGYVVVWREGGTIHVQIFNAAGESKAAHKLTVGQTNLNKIEPDIVVQSDGSFIVAWSGDTKEIRAQKFGIDGTAYLPVLSIAEQATSTSTIKNFPSLATNGGGWAAVWQETNVQTQQGTTDFIRLERVAADGTRTSVEVVSGSGVERPDVTELGGGRHLVTWVISGTVHAAIVAANGSVGTSFIVASGSMGNPSVTTLSTGGFVIAVQNNIDATGGNYITQVYDSQGNAVTQGSHSISTPAGQPPAVIALTKGGYAGGYALVYAAPAFDNNGQRIDHGDIFIRLVKADGTMSEPFMVNDSSWEGFGDQRLPSLAELPDGRISVTWYDPNSSGIRHQIIDGRETAVTVTGTSHNDFYIGSNHGGDILEGKDGNDTLYGGGGNDHFKGGAGADHFVGGDYFGNDNGTEDNVTYLGAKDQAGNLEAVEIYLWDVSRNKGYEAEGDTYVGIEVISGTTKDDILEGDNANNAFWGDDGNDVLKGFGGNDTLLGTAGEDTLYGGLGADMLDGGTGEDRDLVTYEFSTAGVGIVASLDNSAVNTFEAAGDTYIGIDDLTGTMWDDVLIGLHSDRSGASQHNKLSGGGGNDTLIGGWGADTLDGGAGFNFASYQTAEMGVKAYLDDELSNTGEAAGDVYQINNGGKTPTLVIQGLIGSDHGDTLHGSDDNNDELRGGGGDDELQGLKGDDTLQGGLGADKLFGGDGNDYASYADSAAGVTVVLPAGGTGAVGEDTFDSIEGLIGSNHNDMLIGNAFSNHLVGGGGSDTLVGGFGTNTLEGGAGSDVYYASSGDVIIEHAAQGTDTVVVTSTFSLAGGSFAFIENIIVQTEAGVTLTGNDQDNTLNGNAGGDTLNGQGGKDILYGQGGGDGLNGGEGNDVLYGQDGSDALSGENGDDILDGGTGADAMNGGAGNDTFYVDNAGDIANGGSGTDTVHTSVNFTMAADMENLFATGGSALILKGSAIANTITGNAGANKIYGGLGNDVLRGGSGKDTFVFDTKLNKSTNVDRIMDFNVRDDSFHLDNKYFTKLGSGTASKPKKFNSDMFVINNKAKDREDRIVYDKKTGALYYDQDGTGSKAQVKIATLTKNLKLTYSDFFVI